MPGLAVTPNAGREDPKANGVLSREAGGAALVKRRSPMELANATTPTPETESGAPGIIAVPVIA